MADDGPLATVGSKFNRDRTGLRKLVLKFIVSRGDSEPWDLLDTFLPTDLPGDVDEIDRSATKREDGDWDLEVQFGGGSESSFKEDAELDWSGSEDPIESFSNFATLAAKWGAKFDPQDPDKFDGWKRKIKDPKGDGMIPNPLYGFTHFLNDGAVLRVTFNLKTYDPNQLRNLCRIDRPTIKDSRLSGMTTAPDNKNWLKKSVKVQFHGAAFQYVIEWLLSGLGGWVPDVYNPKNPGSGGLTTGSLTTGSL